MDEIGGHASQEWTSKAVTHLKIEVWGHGGGNKPSNQQTQSKFFCNKVIKLYMLLCEHGILNSKTCREHQNNTITNGRLRKKNTNIAQNKTYCNKSSTVPYISSL